MTTEAYDPVHNAPIPAEVCDHLREIPDYDRTGSSFISHQATDLGRPRVAALKAQGAAILCWTIRSVEDPRLVGGIVQAVRVWGSHTESGRVFYSVRLGPALWLLGSITTGNATC